MTNSIKIIIGVIIVALIGAGLYLGNTKLQKGTFRKLQPLPATNTTEPIVAKNISVTVRADTSQDGYVSNGYINKWKITDQATQKANCMGTMPTAPYGTSAVFFVAPNEIVNFEAFLNQQTAQQKCIENKPIYLSEGWKNFSLQGDTTDTVCKVDTKNPYQKKLSNDGTPTCKNIIDIKLSDK